MNKTVICITVVAAAFIDAAAASAAPIRECGNCRL